jgi:hypothetical protein
MKTGDYPHGHGHMALDKVAQYRATEEFLFFAEIISLFAIILFARIF